MWIKEAVADPLICAEHCCKSGFARAGVMRVLYGHADIVPDVDVLVPPVYCAECGECGTIYNDLPECHHFENVTTATLCAGCVDNHRSLC